MQDRLQISALIRIAMLLLTFALSLTGAFMVLHVNIFFDPYVAETGKLIKEHTAPEDKIVVYGMYWGQPFLQADRQGFTGSLTVDGGEWINEPQKLERLKQLGYTKLVLVNPSPFIVALTSVTGAPAYKIVNLHEHLPRVATNWPVVFDSTQMLMLQIPGSSSGN